MEVVYTPLKFEKKYASESTATKAVFEWARLYDKGPDAPIELAFRFTIVPVATDKGLKYGVLLYGLNPKVRGLVTRAQYSGFTILT